MYGTLYSVILLATDSGLERTGYALFCEGKDGFSLVKYGCIFTPKTSETSTRLYTISQEFETLITEYHPDVVVFEQLIFNINKKTVISVAQAQGVLLTLCSKYGAKVRYLTPLQIKQSITGDGHADKKQVEKMLKIELQMEVMPKPDDTVDAIACGMAYLYRLKLEGI